MSPKTYRRTFKEKWKAKLERHFSSYLEVAIAFEVDPDTAENWWEGDNAPQGWAVDYYYENIAT